MHQSLRLSVLLISFVVLWPTVYALPPVPKKKTARKVATFNEEQVVDYFLTTLNKDSLYRFDKGQKVDENDLDTTRQKVWAAWVKANGMLSEACLPNEVQPLDSASVDRWPLPDALEPHPVMPFYYGYKGVKPESGYPLFLYLHGSGDKHQEWNTGLELCKRFQDTPSLYFIPQIPNTGSYYRWWQKAKIYAWNRLLRQALVSETVNPNRLYVLGISEGGYGSQRLAAYYADYWAGAGPMAGGEPLRNAPVENCFNLAFCLRTGEKDISFFRNVLTQKALQEFGRKQTEWPQCYRHRIELIPECGHAIPYDSTTPWLAAQPERNPYPKHVEWENYEMDGVKRKGFFNLWEEESPLQGQEGRVAYSMDIRGNEVSLSVRKVNYKVVNKQLGIEIECEKSYEDLHEGKIRIYLNHNLVDLNNPVTVKVNGQLCFEGMLSPNTADMASSLAAFFDPCRIYPASVLVELHP